MISAIYDFAITTGANRVVRGARIEHVCGDPNLGPDKDHAYGMRIIETALRALGAEVDGPTIFDPMAGAPEPDPASGSGSGSGSGKEVRRAS